MADKKNEPLRLEGRAVILEEVSPKYFPYIVEWRNDPALNKFLNQPFKLTLEMERKWYEEVYLPDDRQLLWVIIDKATQTPIGTTGHTHMDFEKRRCIGARTLLGNQKFANQPAFLEGFFVGSVHMHGFADVQYIHVVKENRKALQLNKFMGFVPNDGEIQYPEELFVNGMEQIELYRTKEMFYETRQKIFGRLGDALFS